MKAARDISVLTVGLALGQIATWSLETFVLADPIPSQIAIAFGTVMAGALTFIARSLEKKDEPNR